MARVIYIVNGGRGIASALNKHVVSCLHSIPKLKATVAQVARSISSHYWSYTNISDCTLNSTNNG